MLLQCAHGVDLPVHCNSDNSFMFQQMLGVCDTSFILPGWLVLAHCDQSHCTVEMIGHYGAGSSGDCGC